MSGLRSRRAMATPARVPPEPTAQMKPSILPPVWAQISGPVVSMWAWRLATLSNWLAQIAPAGSLGGKFLGQAPGIADVVVGVGVGDGVHLDQLGAQQADGVLLLLALGARDDDGGAVAQRRGDHGQADAGVAGGALDDPAAGLQQAAPLGVADDEERGAVLDRLAGVHELGLAQDLAAGGLAGAAQADQRRVADGVEDAGPDGSLAHAGLNRRRTGSGAREDRRQALARLSWTTLVRSVRKPASQ